MLGAAAVCELEHSQMKQIFDGLLGDDIEARLRKTGRVSVYCATAAAFLPSLSGVSSVISPSILATMTARAVTSAGRRSPLGPRGAIYGLASWS